MAVKDPLNPVFNENFLMGTADRRFPPLGALFPAETGVSATFSLVLIKIPDWAGLVLIYRMKKRPFEGWLLPFLKGALKRLFMLFLKPLKWPISIDIPWF